MRHASDTKTSLRQNLTDAACPPDTIERFMALGQDGRKKEQIALLTAHRKVLLEQVRSGQRRLDCLDYLLFIMKKQEEN